MEDHDGDRGGDKDVEVDDGVVTMVKMSTSTNIDSSLQEKYKKIKQLYDAKNVAVGVSRRR